MPDSLFLDSKDIRTQDLDSDALAILDDLYRRLDAHWQHKPVPTDPDAYAPKWAVDSVAHILRVKQGTFGKDSKLPVEWLQAHAPNPLTHHPFATWEQVRGFILHAADSMLADPSYRIGSHFFPTTMDSWFLSKPPRKPRWSCFLRYANKSRSLDLLDLEHQPSHDAKVQRIRGRMSVDAVDAVEGALRARGVDCFPGTSWDRAGKLYAWWKGSEAAQARGQFGAQEDRPPNMRHPRRFDLVAGDFGHLVASVVQWSQSEGSWRGWFPVPGTSEWEAFCDWVSAERGVCLRIIPVGTISKEAQGKRDWESYFSLDIDKETP